MTALTVLQNVRTIQLTRGFNALVDEADYPAVAAFKWHASPARLKFYAKRAYYLQGGIQVQVWLHRCLVGNPEGLHVDHRNGDGLDNRRSNLRVCTPSQNAMNRRHAYGRSKFKGVTGYKRYAGSSRPWMAVIQHPEGRSVNLGRFATETEAARAYDAKARELFGEFACTNAELFSDT